MFCPKCRTEYREGFNTCADCEIELVEELPSAAEDNMPDKRLHPIRDQIDKIIEFIRNNRKATWLFSLFIGVLFYFAYILVKNYWGHVIWYFMAYITSLIDFSSTTLVALITVGVNIITDIPAAFIAAIFCVELMIYALRKQQLRYYVGSASSFLLFDVRHWRFWNAPDIGMMFSSFIGPFLVSFVFVATARLFIKFQVSSVKQRN